MVEIDDPDSKFVYAPGESVNCIPNIEENNQVNIFAENVEYVSKACKFPVIGNLKHAFRAKVIIGDPKIADHHFTLLKSSILKQELAGDEYISVLRDGKHYLSSIPSYNYPEYLIKFE